MGARKGPNHSQFEPVILNRTFCDEGNYIYAVLCGIHEPHLSTEYLKCKCD